MTSPRIVVEGGTFAITRRTLLRKLFWTPSDPAVHQGYLYALGLAQQKYGVAVHHSTLMATHEHLTVTPSAPNVPDFFRYVHRESARFLQEHLGRKYDVPDNIWDKRATHCMRLVDAGAQAAWTLYAHTNCVAAGLVERVAEYPGLASDLGLMKSGTLVVKKPEAYFGKDRPDEIELRFSPPPLLLRAFDGDVEALVYWLRKRTREIEDALRDERRARGQRVLGAARLTRIHPWSEPRTARERRGQTVPTFRVDGDGDPDVRRELTKRLGAERRAFVSDHADALDQWRAGDRDVEFPAGAYLMRALHGAKVAEPYADAILCAPDRELADADPSQGARPSVDVIGKLVRSAHHEHTADLTELASEPRAPRASRAPAETSDPTSAEHAEHDGASDGDGERGDLEPASARPSAEAVHLTPPGTTADAEHPSRLVTLRNRRDRDPP